jgi:hypothetical protein
MSSGSGGVSASAPNKQILIGFLEEPSNNAINLAFNAPSCPLYLSGLV